MMSRFKSSWWRRCSFHSSAFIHRNVSSLSHLRQSKSQSHNYRLTRVRVYKKLVAMQQIGSWTFSPFRLHCPTHDCAGHISKWLIVNPRGDFSGILTSSSSSSFRLLKTQGVAGAVGSSSSTSSSSATSNHPSAISPNDKQSSVASSLLSTVTSASSPTTNTPSLEMLFALERAKALQHQQHQQQQQPQQPNASAAAAIKAFTDIQGRPKVLNSVWLWHTSSTVSTGEHIPLYWMYVLSTCSSK